MQVTGKCGSVLVRLIPAPRGAGIVAARTPKKVLQMAGIDDDYTAATGSTKTLGNFVKVSLACCAWHAGPHSLQCHCLGVTDPGDQRISFLRHTKEDVVTCQDGVE